MEKQLDWALEPDVTKVKNISFSQYQTYAKEEEGCNTKWYMNSVMYLPQQFNAATTLGSVFHNCNERFLLGADSDKELFPMEVEFPVMAYGKEVGKHIAPWYTEVKCITRKEDKGIVYIQEDKLPLERQKIIKHAIHRIIKEGLIVRRKNSAVEHNFFVDLEEGKTKFKGKIDYLWEDNGILTLEDHKNLSSFKYAPTNDPESDKYIGKNTQLLVYAYYMALEYKAKTGELPKMLVIKQNQYCWKEDRFRFPSTVVIFDKCKEVAMRIKKTSVKMWEHMQAESFEDVPKNKNACGNYGGCKLQDVCFGRETVDMYLRRMEKDTNDLIKFKYEQGEEDMAWDFGKTANDISGANEGQEKVLEESEKQDADNTKKPAAVEETKAEAKVLSVAEAKEALDEITTKLEDMGVDLQGKVYDDAKAAWEAAAAKEAEVAKEKEDAEKQAEEVKAAAVKEEKKDKVPKEPKEIKVDSKPKEESVEPAELDFKAAKQERFTGVTLCINCVPQHKLNTITIQEVLKKVGALLAKEKGVDSYYDIDAFDRRDAVSQVIDSVIPTLKGFYILADSFGPDHTSLISALKSSPEVKVFVGLK